MTAICRILSDFSRISKLISFKMAPKSQKTVKLANDCSCMIQCYLLALKRRVNQFYAKKVHSENLPQTSFKPVKKANFDEVIRKI